MPTELVDEMGCGSDRQFNISRALEPQKTKLDLAASILREDNSLIHNLRRDDQELLLFVVRGWAGLYSVAFETKLKHG